MQHKLEVLSQAGLGKNDFSEADNVKFEVYNDAKVYTLQFILNWKFLSFGFDLIEQK
mgnify:CR=1 FL=1